MNRPPSIVTFERLYLGSIAVYLVNAILFWSRSREMMEQMPQLRANPDLAALAGPIMIGSLLITAGLSVLFWYLVARARSVAGKWLVAATEAVGAVLGVLTLIRLTRGHVPNSAGVALGLLATALAVVAAAILFRRDASDWLAVDDDLPEPLA